LVIDGEAMFVGSFNFDNHIEEVAFRVELIKNENGSETLIWTGSEDGVEVVFRSEPYASFWKRFKVNFMRILPIDSML
jgi:hypothetical protein